MNAHHDASLMRARHIQIVCVGQNMSLSPDCKRSIMDVDDLAVSGN